MDIYHYDINITPKGNAAPEITKKELSVVKNELFRTCLTQFRAATVAYDGERNLFSPVELREGDFLVEVRGRAYDVTMKLQKQIRLGELRQPPCPREILQGLDVIMKDNSRRQRVAVGRSFFSPNGGFDLGWGVFASEGFQQSIKSTENGLVLCVDYSVMPFWKPMMVLDFLRENCDVLVDQHMSLDQGQRAIVERALKGLRVTVTHRQARQKFPVCGLTHSIANDIKFRDENSGQEIRLMDYYKTTYGQEIRYKNLPCLDLNKQKQNYVPMEFCRLAEGQKFPKEWLDKNGDKTLREKGLIAPSKRKDKIFDMINLPDGPCRGKILDEFHMSVTKEMTLVTGRILERPSLKLSLNNQPCRLEIQSSDCQWNLLKHMVSSGKKIQRWAIADFSPSRNRRLQSLDIDSFIYNLVKRCWEIGIPMEKNPMFVDQYNMDTLSDPTKLSLILTKAKQKATGHLQILICPMAERHEGYKTLKLIAETEVGIMTQCCLSSLANKERGSDQYFANLALKMNAKLGGSNIELYDSFPQMGDINCPVMFIGADVNHPKSLDINSPSIAAVVATMNWPASNSYASKVQAQPHRTENILNVGVMCLELIEKFAQLNKMRPEKIIYFRDGVSDSQFDIVLNKELVDIKAAIQSDGYKPTITVVVAQKRHSTRFFPEAINGPLRTKSGNVPPGTVVDTRIVASGLFNFFLCSHNGIIGTSKPTHYYVLWDEHGFNSDELQKLTFNLCFTFARCTKPVSLVPPVYYADLLAYRGRHYLEGKGLRSPSVAASSSSSSSSAFPVSFEPSNFPRVHKDVEDGMFFV